MAFPGDALTTTLDPAAIAATCITDPADLQIRLGDVATDIDDSRTAATLTGDDGIAAETLWVVFQALHVDFTQLPRVEQLLANLFVLEIPASTTDRATFDPQTGEGTIVVPELSPGVWDLTASCIIPDFTDPGTFQEAVALAAEAMRAYFDVTSLDGRQVLLELIGDNGPTTLLDHLLGAALPPVMVPQPGAVWTTSFEIPDTTGDFLLALSPDSGPAGTTFVVSGSGCVAAGDWDTRTPIVDTPMRPGQTAGTVIAGEDRWEATLTVPAGTPDGTYEVRAHCDAGTTTMAYDPAEFTVVTPPAPPGGGRLILDNNDPGDAPVAITPGQTITVGNAPDAPCVGGDLVEGSTGGLATDATFASVPDAAGDWETTLEIPADVVPGEYQLMADCLNGEDVVFTYAPIVVEIADDTPTPPTTVPPTTVPPTTVPPSDEQPPTTPPQVGDKPAPPALPVPEQPDYTG